MAKPQSSGAPERPAFSVDSDAPIAFSLVARPVRVSVAGVEVEIPCPVWCMEPHTQRYAFLSDVLHRGRMETLTAPESSTGFCEVLAAEIAQWHGGRPFLMLDAPGDGASAELASGAALAFADQLVAHAASIRAMARMLVGLPSPRA